MECAYDGNSHPVVALTGIQEGDDIRYRVGDGDWQKDMPQITEPGTCDVEVVVRRQISGQPMQYSSLKARAAMGKRQYAIHLPDLEIEEGNDYAIAAEGYQGSQEPVFAYYLDAACTRHAESRNEFQRESYGQSDTGNESRHGKSYDQSVARLQSGRRTGFWL